ncbi:unnamed protein product [Polarella glacialis]|uniref:Uncharacterized protein n=1 Tax=Polarella glacialis TaxID=89957 RepID=A0A813EGB4_POLGL|nr:unnamed protein product [Polarella glacialis]
MCGLLCESWSNYFAGMLFAQLGDELPENLKSWLGWRYISDLCLGLAFVVVAASPGQLPCVAVAASPGQDAPRWSNIAPYGDFFLAPIFGLRALSCSLTEGNLATAADKSEYLQRGYLDTLLSSHLLVEAAQCSFGAYILQRPVGESIKVVVKSFEGDPAVSLPASFWVMHQVSCWIAGVALTKFVEAPIARVISLQLTARA